VQAATSVATAIRNKRAIILRIGTIEYLRGNIRWFALIAGEGEHF